MSIKTLDSKGRWRNKTISFRMSPEEASQLDLLVKLSGLTKQEFVIRALLTPDISVQATVRMRRAIREEMGELVAELRRLRRAGDVPKTLSESIDTVARFVGSFAPESSPLDEEDGVIRSLKRNGGITRQSTAAAPVGTPMDRRNHA